MLEQRFPTLMKVVRSEIKGYEHVRSRFMNVENRDLMNRKLTVFTVCFCMMAFENTFRILDFRFEWQFTIATIKMEGIDFHSDIDLSPVALYRYPLLVPRYHEAPGAVV